MNDQSKPIRVAVIGGGIAGLLLGQLLSSAPGIDAHVFERYENEDSLSGYRIQLSLEILNLLKIHLPPDTWAKVLPSVAKTPKEGYYHSCFMRPNGHVFYTYLPEEFRRTAAVSRIRLRKGLLHESEKWLTTGKKFTAYEEMKDGTIKANFADGSSHVCDLIVGADGITSRVRRTLLPSVQTVQTDLVIIYFKVPYTREVESMIPYKTGSLVSICMHSVTRESTDGKGSLPQWSRNYHHDVAKPREALCQGSRSRAHRPRDIIRYGRLRQPPQRFRRSVKIPRRDDTP
jgi:hypothetical protein